MKLRKEDLDWAAGEGLIDRAQVDPLWEALTARRQEARAAEAPGAAGAPSAPVQRFELVNVAYYFGALIVIGAMGFFMNLGWERFGGGGIFVISAAYAGAFVAAGRWLLRRPETRVPGGLLITMAVCMTPLGMYGLERATGVWPTDSPGNFRDFHVYIRSGWLWMELATVVTSLVALRSVRFPFLSAPLAFVVWYMSMDLAPLFIGHAFIDNERQIVSIVVGLVMLGVSFFMDRRTPEDYAFWGYLFGMMAFWGGMSSMSSGSELNKFLYCMVNVGLIVLSPLLERRVFVVFGGLGVFGYLGYLSYEVFKDSLIFPFALSFLGLAVLAAAVGYTRNGGAVDASIVDKTPEGLVRVLPRSRKAKA